MVLILSGVTANWLMPEGHDRKVCSFVTELNLYLKNDSMH